MRTHTVENPYHCNQCRVGFLQESGFKKHIKTHTDKKPYHCKQCTVGFSQESGFKKDIRTHTDKKPYPCKQNTCSWILPEAESSFKKHMTILWNDFTWVYDVMCKDFKWVFMQGSHEKNFFQISQIYWLYVKELHMSFDARTSWTSFLSNITCILIYWFHMHLDAMSKC